jgi:2-polyprenyl-3-methyl-5-hydroxy-6-metoxy-1,4-benzoquinol methylase
MDHLNRRLATGTQEVTLNFPAIPNALRFGQMPRADELELLEMGILSEEEVEESYRQIHILHRFLGNSRAVIRLLKQQKHENRLRLRSVLDIGCGRGALLRDISKQLGIQVVGFDLRPAPQQFSIRIVTGDATKDPLPKADVATCFMMAHHLTPAETVALIQNVSRSCNRLILLDLVRHPLPLALFRVFMVPFLCHTNQMDGQTSIRRAYTKIEMSEIVTNALSKGDRTGRPVRRMSHTVSAFWTRQIVDIEWEPDPGGL